MKKHVILIIAVIFVGLTSCYHNGKQYYKSPTGKIITVWKDYIIFGKYEDKTPPTENYIQMHYKQYQPNIYVTFKSNDSVVLYYGSYDTIDVNFNQDNYKVQVFGEEYYNGYEKRTAYSDTLVTFKFYYEPIYDLFDKIGIKIFEFDGDSVYLRSYRNNTHNYKDHVFSRYELINKYQ